MGARRSPRAHQGGVGNDTRVEPFSGKLARATGGFFKLMLIDRSGRWVTQAKWLSPLSSGRIVVLTGNGRCTEGECDFRIADASGRVVALEPEPRRPKRLPVGSSVFKLR